MDFGSSQVASDVEKPKRTRKCGMLGEIYNWFTEGFNTADLKDAKTLLDHLTG